MKKLILVIIMIIMCGCKQSSDYKEENYDSLREYYNVLQESKDKLVYSNEKQKLVLLNDVYFYEEGEYLNKGNIIYVDENLYLLKSDKKTVLIESEEYIVPYIYHCGYHLKKMRPI